jgi:hypothetical protein
MRIAVLALALAIFAVTGDPQSSATATLSLRIEPEAVLSVTRLPLRVRIPTDGDPIVISTATVAARVRTAAGNAIRVVARPMGDLAGPSGTIPIREVRWTAVKAAGVGGAGAASCADGTLGEHKSITADWTSSGILACSITFLFQNSQKWTPGEYESAVEFSIETGNEGR